MTEQLIEGKIRRLYYDLIMIIKTYSIDVRRLYYHNHIDKKGYDSKMNWFDLFEMKDVEVFKEMLRISNPNLFLEHIQNSIFDIIDELISKEGHYFKPFILNVELLKPYFEIYLGYLEGDLPMQDDIYNKLLSMAILNETDIHDKLRDDITLKRLRETYRQNSTI